LVPKPIMVTNKVKRYARASKCKFKLSSGNIRAVVKTKPSQEYVLPLTKIKLNALRRINTNIDKIEIIIKKIPRIVK